MHRPHPAVRSVVVLGITLALAGAGAGAAGIPVSELFPGGTFDPGIPTPGQAFGFEPGARPIRHDELNRYLGQLAEVSPRALLRTYARTHEGRDLVVFAVSDEATLAGLDTFREEHARRVDPRQHAPDEDAARLAQAKAVAWMAYGIHGDELSSVDAAAALAYRLVAGEDDAARRLRRELVILIDPCENPDGRERFLAQTTSFAHATPNPDVEDLSHTTVWPWGRGNHYLFDLNRDWFSMVQPESRRSAVIASWNPQLMVDSHEMGSHDTYLFSPPRHPFNPHLPANTLDWADAFAADQARALDARGYVYYSGEWNEEFFPGYGSSWASYLGAVGILYEMARTAGTLVHQRPGTVRTFAEAVEHQVTSSLANLTTLAENRRRILAEFVAGRREVIDHGQRGPLGAWVLPEGRYPERTRALVRRLRLQGIEVSYSTEARPEVRGLRDARTGASVDASSLPPATWLVALAQPAGALARVLLDPHVPIDAAFLREEREYLERGRGTRLYETTAWSMPLAYGIEAYWTARRPVRGWVTDREPSEPVGALETLPEPAGFVMEGTSDASVAALADLLQQELAVRVAAKPFLVSGRSFDRGALWIKREGNPEDLASRLAEVAETHRVRIMAIPTAKAQAGPDLGGRHYRLLRAPRIGVWSGMPVSPSSFGALWHLLDRKLGLRFSNLDIGRFGWTDLSRYNVLIFPPVFRAGAYEQKLGPEGLKALKRWVEAGGTAIGIGSGAEFLASKKLELTRTRLRREALDTYPPAVLGPGPETAEAAGAFRAVGIRAPREPDDEEPKGGPDASPKRSPHDVAPVLGAGAAPFDEGFGQGPPVDLEPVDLLRWLEPVLPPGQDEPELVDLKRADARLRRFSPRGTFVRVELDREIWLTWGLPDEVAALARARDTLVAEPPVQVAARFAALEELHLGGLLWPEAAARLARTAYATREGRGRGQVILFLNEPEFRGFTLGTRRILLNAILYGPGLGARRSTPW